MYTCYSVDSCDLKPDENPWIVFKSDSAMLRESITSYGRVESSASTSAFVKPGNPARSLPPHFEDYDDADHHVLYKTVEGVTKSTQDTTVGLIVVICSRKLGKTFSDTYIYNNLCVYQPNQKSDSALKNAYGPTSSTSSPTIKFFLILMLMSQ
jgi:hypothetical protein